MTNLLLDPLAVQQALIDRFDAAIAKFWVVIAGIDQRNVTGKV